ncbi:MAG: M23 family metallopeptidase [Bryobacterales bacterium]|nr:M23 family metallopeptidase [Bryobacterales bacterium]
MLRRTLLAALPLAAQGTAPLRVLPEKPFPGSPILFSVADGPASGTWMERPLTFAQDEKTKRWVALAAVNYELKAGPQILELGGGGKHTVQIAPHAYRTGRLTVAPRFVSPPKAVLKRIAAEREIKKTAFATRSKRAWAGPFAAPAGTARTSPFGTRRTYNGKTQSVHQGLDFGAAIGTPIRASNHGRVLIAQEMYYEGGFVVLDHGDGLFTLYMHLSKFEVAAGDAVEKGAVIAASGSSGRVTGPHLHFGVQWQGLYMEPGTLLEMAL